jgi:putative transposase
MKKLDSKKLKAYRYRIYPNKEQRIFFAQTFGVRFVWNLMLAEKIEALKNKQPLPTITPAKYKEEYLFLKDVDSLALMNAQRNLDSAFKNYFKNPKHYGFPKFKKKAKQSYTTSNVNNNIKIDFEKGLLYLPKIKDGIEIEIHRKFRGRIVSATVSRNSSGNYYVSILVELENEDNRKNKTRQPKNKVCGIDLGLKEFAIITDDTRTYKIEHPKYLRKAEKRLKGSKNFEKARIRLAKQYEYVANLRNDFLHKLSKAIIDENQVIVVENLSAKGMQQNLYLSKLISDSGFGTFVRYLEYKADWYGRQFIKVDRFYPSSKLCNVCGYKHKELKLSDRYWTCPICGTYHNRDVNASINLYKVGAGAVRL